MDKLVDDLIFFTGLKLTDQAHKKSDALSFIRELLSMAYECGFSGNLWRSYIAKFIALNENPFSLSFERSSFMQNDSTIKSIALHDCEILRELFFYDFTQLLSAAGDEYFKAVSNYMCTKKPNSFSCKIIEDLKIELENTTDVDDFFNTLANFYTSYGAGTLGTNKTFIVKNKDDTATLVPTYNADHVRLDDLIGYEIQKERLTDNTKAFLQGKAANNVLLFGDAGTGKSTSIRALANEYWNEGLRIIQVHKNQMQYLDEIITHIKFRNYKFIVYMDDLSFEDYETEYKYLKAIIEGGLEPKPKNILVYATSNRRHIVKETWSDRDDMEHTGEMHRGDSVEEKLSLSDRFGLQIYYGKPTREEFHQIVEAIAIREKINIDLKLLHQEATKWEIRKGSVSGRSARQFIDYIKGMEEQNK